MKATEFLQAAIDVQSERGKQYDSPEGERSMGRTVQAFNAITGRDLTEAEGWLLLQVLKDVRQWSAKGFHADSALDGVAYSSLKAEALSAETPDPGQVREVEDLLNGWVQHDGRGCPVAEGTPIELRHRDGDLSGPELCRPKGRYWHWVDAPGEVSGFDIVAYRVAR